MFTLLMDRDGRNLPIAPVLNYSDHKSGKRYLAPQRFMDCLMGFWGDRFFIRSVLQPNLFWFYDKQIHVSTSQRTAFFIQIVGTAEENDERIMIGSDRVSIAVEQGRFLAIRQGGDEFYFSDFDGKFKREVAGDGEMVITGQDPLGERWELVF